MCLASCCSPLSPSCPQTLTRSPKSPTARIIRALIPLHTLARAHSHRRQNLERATRSWRPFLRVRHPISCRTQPASVRTCHHRCAYLFYSLIHRFPTRLSRVSVSLCCLLPSPHPFVPSLPSPLCTLPSPHPFPHLFCGAQASGRSRTQWKQSVGAKARQPRHQHTRSVQTRAEILLKSPVL